MHNTSTLLIRSVLCVATIGLAAGQQPASVQQKVRAYRLAHEKEIVREFVHLLSIPNRASDISNIERNSEFIKTMLESRGVAVRMLRVQGAPPVVFGELRTPGVGPTIGIYAHYDGQPVDPTQWLHPPFSPAVRDASGRDIDWQTVAVLDPEWRIYARSTSDDKAPIEGTVVALDAL